MSTAEGLNKEPAKQNAVSFASMVPETWLQLRDRTVLVSGFECVRVAFDRAEPRILDAEGLRVLIFFGRLKYPASGRFRLFDASDGNMRGEGGPLTFEDSAEGVHALVLTLSAENPEHEAQQRMRTQAAVGVLRTEWGPNFAVRKVCEYAVTLPDGPLVFWSPVVRNPSTLPVVDATDKGLAAMDEVLGALARLQQTEKHAAELAFRWHADAMSHDGPDSLIKTWIAIEALSMMGDTNINALKDLLACEYRCTRAEINAQLGLGLLFGLRSKVVHGLAPGNDHGAILDHARAVFRDVARARLGLPCGRFAEKAAGEALPLLVATQSRAGSDL